VQLQSERVSAANPRMEVNAEVHGRGERPVVRVGFKDGSEEMRMETDEVKVEEIKGDLFQRLMEIEQEYDAQGKTVD